MKKKIILIISLLLIIGIILLVLFFNEKSNNFIELKYNEVIDKIENKESFVLVISQTTCSHCASYKPKLEKITKDYDINIYYIEANLLDKKEKEEFNKYIYYNGTPLTLFFINGEEPNAISRLSGDKPIEKVVKNLKKYEFIK